MLEAPQENRSQETLWAPLPGSPASKLGIMKGPERGQAIATTTSPGEEDRLCRTTGLVR
jgi:hypothetical protein